VQLAKGIVGPGYSWAVLAYEGPKLMVERVAGVVKDWEHLNP